uniref:AP2/ERF domain-containing protein n=1 Tax=Oryza nivara TaxID=4536 RepID=A0A0E0FJP4_ORYNI
MAWTCGGGHIKLPPPPLLLFALTADLASTRGASGGGTSGKAWGGAVKPQEVEIGRVLRAADSVAARVAGGGSGVCSGHGRRRRSSHGRRYRRQTSGRWVKALEVELGRGLYAADLASA